MVDIPDNTFDGGFAFEATCHAKSLVLVYKEIYRVLKPGALFADMAWCVTDNYDPQNPQHLKVMNGVMVSIILCKLIICEVFTASMVFCMFDHIIFHLCCTLYIYHSTETACLR